MLDSIPYLIYFLGPFLLAFFLGKRLLNVTYKAFVTGMLAFFLAWMLIMAAVQTPAALSDLFKEGTVWYALLVSVSAGLFEESSRYIAFRSIHSLRTRRDWKTGVMYAIGHSGMESLIVGGNLLLTVAVVTYMPEVLSPEILSQAEEVLAIGAWDGIYSAVERLFVGLLIHGCFTLVVVLSLLKPGKKWLLVAMLWHFGHDMVAFNLHHLSEHWVVEKLWIGFIVIVYSWIFIRLKRRIAEITRSAAVSEQPSRPE